MKYNKHKSEKMLIEYVSLSGKCREKEYLTLKSKIVYLSQEKKPIVNELELALDKSAGDNYRDITIDSYDEDEHNREYFKLTLKELTALINALNIRNPEKLKGKMITALYEKEDESYSLIGFVRPQDRIKLEERILFCPHKLVK